MRSPLHRPVVFDCELTGRHADRGAYVDALNEKDEEIRALRAQVAERDRIIGRLLAGEPVAATEFTAMDAEHATGCCAKDGIDCVDCLTGRCAECRDCVDYDGSHDQDDGDESDGEEEGDP